MTAPLDEAVQALARGGIVVYPTDTLYGLGARISDEEGVRRVFEAKGRPLDQPLSVAFADASEIEGHAHVTPLARRLFSLLPGPVTLVLRKRDTVPDLVTGGEGSVGVRVPDHPLALQLLRAVGPLTATSANRHGDADPSTLEACRRALDDRVDYYLPSPTPLLRAASTLVDARGDAPRILRPGVLGVDRIRECLSD